MASDTTTSVASATNTAEGPLLPVEVREAIAREVQQAVARASAASNLSGPWLQNRTGDRGDPDDELVNVAEAAIILDLSPSHLNKMRCRGDGPKFVRLGRRAIRYRRCDLRSYAEGRLADSTSEYAA
ncbi:MAG: helix-turn-helix transcriptional regulator [Minwuia sp.]|uniref:helix-turn-helix transcriptional regulator n=1 Tax=Minwuia sp. TaxID=2493630 RepID=UPI003A86403D